MGRSIADNTLRSEFLRLAGEPGCIVCHAAQEAVDRFFAWYLIEQYHEPSIIKRMQKAHGFCLPHTRQFVAISSPHLVSTVYRELFASATILLRSLIHDSSTLTPGVVERIRPQTACLACEHQQAAVSWIARGLPGWLTDSQVCEVLARPSALCLLHFVQVLPSLNWQGATLLAHAQLASLSAAGAEDESSTEPEKLVKLLVGAISNEAFLAPSSRSSLTSAEDVQDTSSMREQDAQGMPGRSHSPLEQPSWSPALARMEALLKTSGCPLCREEEDTTAIYLRWLSEELSKKTPSQGLDEARWLCQQHLWHFLRIGNEQAVGSLLASASAYWTSLLQTLVSGLDRPPPTSFLARGWHGMIAARQRPPRVTGWRALQEGIAQGRMSMTKRLARLREALMRTHLCPACRFQREHADRLVDLLDSMLGDSGLARHYEAADGICFRHLPLAISRCRQPVNVSFLLRTQYTRLAVIHWELEEYWRKRDWTHRWEPRGYEQTAWCRAINQYTGREGAR
jgi:hypothetical protein